MASFAFSFKSEFDVEDFMLSVLFNIHYSRETPVFQESKGIFINNLFIESTNLLNNQSNEFLFIVQIYNLLNPFDKVM